MKTVRGLVVLLFLVVMAGVVSPSAMAAVQPIAWYKADTITGVADGSALSSWSDSSASGNNLSQSDASRKPTYQDGVGGPFNGKPYVTFDQTGGTNRSMQSINYLGLSGDFATTVFIVADEGRASGYSSLYGLGYAGNVAGAFGIMQFRNGGAYSIEYGGGNPAIFTMPSAGTQITESVKSAGPINTTTKLYVDGTALPIQAGSSTATPNLTDYSFELGIWGRPGDASSWGAGTSGGDTAGRIAEAIVFSGTLTTADRNYWGSYLASKYGIQSVYVSEPSVPEPTTLALLSLGVSGLLLRRKA